MSLPLVLVPGLMCDARVFSHQIEVLSRERPVMIAPPVSASRIETLAGGLLAKSPPRFALAGLGFGGMVAMDVLRQAPERVERLCLIATSPLAETPDEAAAREPFIVRAQAGRLEEVLPEAIGLDGLADGPGRAAAQAQAQQMGRDLGAEVLVRQLRALQRRRDQQATLRRFKAGALVLCGAQDRITPVKRHRFLAELIPGARFELLEGSSHLPPLEQPEAVAGHLRSWLGHPMVLR